MANRRIIVPLLSLALNIGVEPTVPLETIVQDSQSNSQSPQEPSKPYSQLEPPRITAENFDEHLESLDLEGDSLAEARSIYHNYQGELDIKEELWIQRQRQIVNLESQINGLENLPVTAERNQVLQGLKDQKSSAERDYRKERRRDAVTLRDNYFNQLAAALPEDHQVAIQSLRERTEIDWFFDFFSRKYNEFPPASIDQEEILYSIDPKLLNNSDIQDAIRGNHALILPRIRELVELETQTEEEEIEMEEERQEALNRGNLRRAAEIDAAGPIYMVSVVDANLRTADQIAYLLDPQISETFQTTFRKAAYPRIYRDQTPSDRLFDIVNDLNLSGEQEAAVSLAYESYLQQRRIDDASLEGFWRGKHDRGSIIDMYSQGQESDVMPSNPSYEFRVKMCGTRLGSLRRDTNSLAGALPELAMRIRQESDRIKRDYEEAELN